MTTGPGRASTRPSLPTDGRVATGCSGRPWPIMTRAIFRVATRSTAGDRVSTRNDDPIIAKLIPDPRLIANLACTAYKSFPAVTWDAAAGLIYERYVVAAHSARSRRRRLYRISNRPDSSTERLRRCRSG